MASDPRLPFAITGASAIIAVLGIGLDFIRLKSYGGYLPLSSSPDEEPVASNRVAGGKRNRRWRTLDRGESFIIFLVMMVAVLDFGFKLSKFLSIDEAERELLPLVPSFLWAAAWSITYAWNILVLKHNDSDVGTGLLSFFFVSLLGKFLLVRMSPPSSQDDSKFPEFLDVATLLSLLLLSFIELSQRYWQSIPLVDPNRTERFPSPESKSSFLSRLTYTWMDPLMIKAQEKPLEEEDIWELDPSDQSSEVLKNFEAIQKKSKTLFEAVFRYVFFQLAVIFISSIFVAVLGFSGPLFLNLIVKFLQKPEEADPNTGYILLFALMACTAASALLDGYVWFMSRRVALRVRTILVSAIYTKALRRAAGVGKDKGGEESDGKASIGKIVTIMSSDTERVVNLMFNIQRPLIITPLNIVLGIAFLLQVLGPSGLAGLGVVLLSGPLAGYVSSGMMKNQRALSTATDKRTSVTNEAFQGIKIIKYFGWEPQFIKRILDSRETELSKVRNLWTYFLGLYIIAFGGSILVIFISFFFYSVVAGHPLDAATAFTSISLLKRLSIFLNILPMIMMQLSSGKVAFDRVAGFLKEEELEKFAETSDEKKEPKANETTPLLSASAGAGSSSKRISAAPGELRVGISEGQFIYFGNDKEKKDTKQPAKKWLPWGKKSGTKSTEEEAEGDNRQIFTLRNVSVDFPIGKLSVVLGPTGSGKTSLLFALLGEMKREAGEIFLPDPREIPGGVAYVAQTAFLLNGTIRDNILFGNTYDEQRYVAVLEACALVRDLENLDGGDLTEIGEKGINLSGGQKQRISLARAVYSPSQIVLLDDPLSAVDAPTAKHLLKKCILGPLLAGRTKILVTHALGLVFPHADFVVMMNNGEIAGQGTKEEIIKNPEVDLSLPAPPPYSNASKSEDSDDEDEKKRDPNAVLAVISKEGTKIVDAESMAKGSVKLSVYLSFFAACGGALFFIILLVGYVTKSGMFVARDVWVKIWTDSLSNKTSEARLDALATGLISMTVPASFMPTLNTFVSSNPSKIGDNFLSSASVGLFYNSSLAAGNETMVALGPANAVDENGKGTGYYIGIYALLSFLTLLAGILMEIWTLYSSLVASRSIHLKLLNRVFHSPLRFFEKTPVGRLLNRFTKVLVFVVVILGVETELLSVQDLSTVDNYCVSYLDAVLSLLFDIFQSVVIILVAAPLTLVFLLPLSFAYWIVSRIFLNISRELKRLNSVTTSPIYSQFSETLVGVSTIRAYGSEKRSALQLDDKLNINNRNNFYLWTANRWLNLRCELLSAFFTFIVGFFIIELRLSPGWAGLTLSYAFQLTMYLTSLIRCHADLDMSMNAVERIEEYCVIEQEPPFVIESARPPTNVSSLFSPLSGILRNEKWPDRGAIEIKNLSLRYTPETPMILKNLTFDIKPHEKIGVVGRTGAGKSTLSLAFFRIIPFEKGRILIDGIDIHNIGLHDLRSRLTIIPQDPVLFEGTLKSNIDPLDAHTDEEIWNAIRDVGLLESMQKKANGKGKEVAEAGVPGSVSEAVVRVEEDGEEKEDRPFQLSDAVNEGGTNFSQGQRQLICMARAMLRKTKLIILDEATASVDELADSKIQEGIRSAFKDGTVITIAHRLKTIIDYDRVLVLDHGEIAEYDTPFNLVSREAALTGRGQFRRMCEETGEFDELLRIARRVHLEKGGK
ncbi:hypothetical protein HDU97_005074 [Phlyctochytrium planicorne]|nr:hypothetical protein HDU97_005074 [Phlyctochytrium planicorne]